MQVTCGGVGRMDPSILCQRRAGKINTCPPPFSFFFFYLLICLSLSHPPPLSVSARAAAARQPFALISNGRTQGTPGEPGQLAKPLGLGWYAPGPGSRLCLPHHFITPKPWLYIAVHFPVCHKCHSPDPPVEMTAPARVTPRQCPTDAL